VPDLKCYACEREPTQQCARCGRPYCDEHGEDFCNVCLEPSTGVPSVNLYRGSLLALVIGAVVALVLIVQPNGASSESAFKPTIVTPTASTGAAGNLTTPAAGGSPAAQTTPGTPRPGTTATPPAGGTARPATTGTTTASTPAASGTTTTGDYVVVAGDTLTGICSQKLRLPASQTTPDCVAQVKTLNGLTSDDISVGQHLKVPQ
jgi:LysM repeat protein